MHCIKGPKWFTYGKSETKMFRDSNSNNLPATEADKYIEAMYIIISIIP